MMYATVALPSDAHHLSHITALLDGARRFLDQDTQLARHYLEQISVLLTPAAPPPPALVSERIAAPDRPLKGGLAGWQTRKIIAHIDRNLAETLSTEALAEVVRLSTGHFCRAFKASMGETPHGYIMRQRIRRAQILMLESNDSLSDIACACGLTDQAHLTRLFRRATGTTPMLWRRNWQQEI